MSSARTILVLLLMVLALEVALGFLAHRSQEDLVHDALTAPPRQRAYAMHVLANRDQPEIYDAQDVRRLMADEEALLRELAMTYDFARSDGAALQREILDTQEVGERTRFFKRHQKLPMRRRHIRAYFAAPR